MPAVVVSYDASTQTATVQPMVNDVRFDVDTGERVSEPWPQIQGVPIVWPRFGGFVIAGPLKQYDPVELVAYDMDPTAWQQSAAPTLQPVDPPDPRRHGGNYWRAFPGDCRQNPASSPGSFPDALVIGIDGGDPIIVIQGSTIQFGKTAGGGAAALATKVDAIFAKLKTVAADIALLVANPSTGDISAATVATLVMDATALEGAIATVASQLVTLDK
jgi:hypothetical protein